MLRITPAEYLETLFGEPVGPGSLVVRTRSNRGVGSRAYWLDTLDHAARVICDARKSHDVWVAVTLQERARALQIARRRRPRATEGQVTGGEVSATLLPALWVDLNFAGAGRRRGDLPPSPEAALGLLRTVQWRPSMVIRSGRGFQVIWLLNEPLVLDSSGARLRARDLVSRLQALVIRAAADEGWDLAQSPNLGHLLRVPGTFDHRVKPRAEVTLEYFPVLGELERRYAPEEFLELPQPEPEGELALLMRDSGVAPGDLRDVDLRPVVGGCRFLQYAYKCQGSLPEDEWDAALGVVTRCRVGDVDGRRLGHRYSREHPGHTLEGTDARIERAWATRGPATCGRIERLSARAAACCAGCEHRGQIEGPIHLGLGHPKASAEVQTPDGAGSRTLVSAAVPTSDRRRRGGVLVQLVPPNRSVDGGAAIDALPEAVWIDWPHRRTVEIRGESASGDADLADTVADGVLGDLVGGLSELLDPLGGVASSKEILDQLAVAPPSNDDAGEPIVRLRSALAELFPDLKAGELPTPAQLSAKLSSLRGRVAGGSAIVRGPRSNRGLRWSVRWVGTQGE